MPSSIPAFSPIGILNAIAAFTPVQRHLDIAFGPGQRDRLDVYAGPGDPHALSPTVVFFHGGGWDSGDRGMYAFVGAALAARGIVTVIPNYRVYPETLFPGFLEDAARATLWVRDNIGQFGGDADRMILAGHSAGAHIAAMLALDARWLDGVGLDKSLVRGLIGLAGPYDFLPLHSPVLKTIFGPEPGLAATQPINFVGAEAPPALLIAPKHDTIVDPQNSVRLARRIGQLGGSAELKLYPRVGHASLAGAFAWPLRPLAPVLRDTVDFVRSVTSPPQRS